MQGHRCDRFRKAARAARTEGEDTEVLRLRNIEGGRIVRIARY
jgi:hypothetical protein